MSVPEGNPVYVVKMLIRIISNVLIIITVISLFEDVQVVSDDVGHDDKLHPTVMVSFFVRNKAHTLPYFLHYLENLDYPKERMVLWIRADHNIDSSLDILEPWIVLAREKYHWVSYLTTDNGVGYNKELSPCHWTDERFTHLLQLRQQALDGARETFVDYLLFVDVDNLLMNDQVLLDLIRQDKTIVSPMLNATESEHYTNFWGAMNEHGYYARSENYKAIQLGHLQGCHQVAMTHSTMLLDLTRVESTQLKFYPPPEGYSGPYDDIIIFAHAASYVGVGMWILNDDFYGYMMMPMDESNTLDDEMDTFLHLRTEAIVDVEPLKNLSIPGVPTITHPEKTKLGFDEIYMINLERQEIRRTIMLDLFDELGIDATLWPAVDGKQLNSTYLDNLGVQLLPGYIDSYSKRPMTLGEIGCFLSHYNIWKDVVNNGYDQVIVFEDDVRFEKLFHKDLATLMEDIKRKEFEWDLIYIGRKQLSRADEAYVSGVDRLVWCGYTYWTLGYLLSQSGAQKLLHQDPIAKMVPVDEYLPIMFDKHPESKYKDEYSPRDLIALSIHPLLIYPTHYTGQPGYISDTEQSEVVPQENEASDGSLADMEIQGPDLKAAHSHKHKEL